MRRRRRKKNPDTTDILLLAGLVGVAGVGIWYFWPKSTPAIPAGAQAASNYASAAQLQQSQGEAATAASGGHLAVWNPVTQTWS